MSTSPVNRQPQGIPAGGHFALSTHSEPAVALAPAAQPVTLAPGESGDFTEYADGDVIVRLSVLRSDDGGTFHVEASKFLNFKDIIPGADLGTDEADRDAWLEPTASSSRTICATATTPRRMLGEHPRCTGRLHPG